MRIKAPLKRGKKLTVEGKEKLEMFIEPIRAFNAKRMSLKNRLHRYFKNTNSDKESWTYDELSKNL